jgi:hypothetical protein
MSQKGACRVEGPGKLGRSPERSGVNMQRPYKNFKLRESLLQVRDQVVGVLESHGDAHGAGSDAC